MAKEKSKVITHIIYINDEQGYTHFEDGTVVREDEDLDTCVERYAAEIGIEIRDIPKFIRVVEVKSILIPTPGKFTYTEISQ